MAAPLWRLLLWCWTFSCWRGVNGGRVLRSASSLSASANGWTAIEALAGKGTGTSSPSPAEVTLIGKVTEMLQEMEAKSTALQQQASLDSAAAQASCSQDISTQESALQNLQLQVQSLEASVATGETQVTTLQQEVLQLAMDITILSTQLEALRLGRTNQTQAFSQELTDLNFAIAAVDRAIDALQSQASSLLAVAPNKGANHTALQELMELHSRYTPDTGGIAKDEHIFDEFQDLATAKGAYVPASTSVQTTLASLRQSFGTQKSALISRESTDRTTYQREEQSYVDRLATAKTDEASRKSTLATTQGDLLTHKQELAQTQQTESSTSTYLEQLKKDCAAKQRAFEEVIALRASELRAIQAALQIITGQLSSPARPSLLRTRQALSSVRKPTAGASAEEAMTGTHKVIGFLNMEAEHLHSASLHSLVSQLGTLAAVGGTHLGQSPSDPLAEVKQMITQLILRLQQQATHEAGHHAWCQTELQRNEQAQSSAAADLDKQTARAQKLQGDVQQLAQEIAELNATVMQNEARRQQLEEQRTNQSSDNAQVLADAQSSAAAVAAAILLLEDFYANLTTVLQSGFQASSTGTSTNASAAAVAKAVASGNVTAPPLPEEARSIISMLEVVRDDYTDLATKTQAIESNATQQFTEETRALAVATAAATRDRDLKQAQRGVYIAQLEQAKDNVNTSTQELQDARAAYEALKPPCVETETYEERKMRRDTEIQALQEAYAMLEQLAQEVGGAGVSSFVQSAVLEASYSNSSAGGSANSTALQDPSALQTVAGLLRGMQSEVSAELAADEQAHQQMQSWCAESTQQLRSALDESMDREQQLMTVVESSVQSVAQLEVQIQQMESELAKEVNSLQQQGYIHEEAMQTAHDSEVELVVSIQKLSQAIGIIENRQQKFREPALNATAERQRLEAEKQDIYAGLPPSNTSAAEESLLVAADVQLALRSLPADEASTANQALQGFLAKPQDYLLPSTDIRHAALAEFHSQLLRNVADTDQVIGVLRQLLETMQADLQALQLRREQDTASAKGLRETKAAQIAALEASLSSRRSQLAQHRTVHSDAKSELAYLRQAYQADTQRLTGIQQTCTESEQEFQARNATRMSEMTAINEAVTILEEDMANLASGNSSSSSSSLLLHSAEGSGHVFMRHTPANASLVKPTGRPNAASVVDAFLRDHRQPTRGNHPHHLTEQLQANPSGLVLWRPEAAVASGNISALAQANNSDVGGRRLAVVATHVHVAAREAASRRLHRHKEAVSPLASQAVARVIQEIDVLVASVQKEGQLEVRMRDTCVREDQQARQQLERRLTEGSTHNATQSRLKTSLADLGPQIATLQADIMALNASLGTLQSRRVQDATQFQQDIQKEQNHQAQLRRAIEILRAHYLSAGASLMRLQAVTANSSTNVSLPDPVPNISIPNWTAPNRTLADRPKGFATQHDHHEGGQAVISIIELLVHDSEAAVKEMLQAEETGRDTTVTQLNNIQQSIDDKERQIVALEVKQGQQTEALQQTESMQAACEQEIVQINAFLTIVANKCTTLLTNFDANQEQRRTELASLQDAKFYLQGMVPASTSGALLAFPDHAKGLLRGPGVSSVRTAIETFLRSNSRWA